MLSEETTIKFRAALREHCSDPAGSQARMRAAVDGAVSEAHRVGMSSERFVIWVKRIWDEITDEGWLSQSVDPARVRDSVISLAIKAYYVQ